MADYHIKEVLCCHICYSQRINHICNLSCFYVCILLLIHQYFQWWFITWIFHYLYNVSSFFRLYLMKMQILKLLSNILLSIDHYKKVEILIPRHLWSGFGNLYFKEQSL
ncbi:unnamed protein product [Paramecium sonneborni]|uniref:Uncharacterized protein n=1 Tax=Paramecium sonneborni TaxID=65129 RepID=A0A8S1LUT3_9CILI|nr:unnamed protein product [Paramecium sonneborni]